MTEAKRIATLWLDGCSGCHMSFLDLDEGLLELLGRAKLVYGPLVDTKEFPEGVDITLVEGAVATNEDEERIRTVRGRTRVLVSMGDCAITGNVPAMRNPYGVEAVMRRAFDEHADAAERPSKGLPVLLDRVVPVHQVVKVDFTLPGCPPSAETIGAVVGALIEDRDPKASLRGRFGS